VDTLNVWRERLPEFDYEAIGAKYKAVKREAMTEAESKVWERIQLLIQRFQNADRIVLGTYDGKQYGPLLNVEKAIVVYTRGSRFLEGTPIPPSRFDHQATYLDFLVAPGRCSVPVQLEMEKAFSQ
jgi:FMN-dependent NADH-azoreductase